LAETKVSKEDCRDELVTLYKYNIYKNTNKTDLTRAYEVGPETVSRCLLIVVVIVALKLA